MIEFVGHLTGNAFKYYKKTMIKTSQIVFLIGFGIAMPIMFFVFNLIGSVDLESILFAASVCLLSAIFLPYPILKFAKGDVTRRIYINDGLVNAVSCEGRTHSAQICAIKKVKDFGDYYAMTLPGICAIVSVYFTLLLLYLLWLRFYISFLLFFRLSKYINTIMLKRYLIICIRDISTL